MIAIAKMDEDKFRTDMLKKDYYDYWFHIKGAIIGQVIGLVDCLAIGGVVGLI